MSLQEIAIFSGPIFHIYLNRDFTLDCDNFQLFILFRVKASLQWRAGCMTQRKEGTKEFRIALVTLSSWPDKRAWKKSEERLHHAILCMQYTGLCALLCVCVNDTTKSALTSAQKSSYSFQYGLPLEHFMGHLLQDVSITIKERKPKSPSSAFRWILRPLPRH